MQITTSHDIKGDLVRQLYSRVEAAEITFDQDAVEAWAILQTHYLNLPVDEYLPGGLKYRFRRFDQFYFMPSSGELVLMPHTNYFQDKDINTVTGGIVREFAPLLPETAQNPFLHALIRFDFDNLPISEAERVAPWKVDVHLIRVVATSDIQGHPTPEGIHRDGAAFVSVHLAELENVSGGEASVYDNNKELISSFRLKQIHDVYYIHDAKVWHSAEPIAPVNADSPAIRSILTFDFHPQADLSRPE